MSHEFCHFTPRRGMILTISGGQFRLYCNRPREPDTRAGFVHRVWRFAPSFDVGRGPMDHVYWRWGDFSYIRGENSDTHTRYRLVSAPIWLPILPLVIAGAAAGLGRATNAFGL